MACPTDPRTDRAGPGRSGVSRARQADVRWAIFDHLDAALFLDLGSVGPTPGDLLSQDLKRSYGAGVRIHNDKTTIGRVDLAKSHEGWRIIFKMNDPFRRSAQSADALQSSPSFLSSQSCWATLVDAALATCRQRASNVEPGQGQGS